MTAILSVAGHPSEYLKGYNLTKTLQGHGMKVKHVNGEDFADLYAGMCEAMSTPGPCECSFILLGLNTNANVSTSVAVISQRKMAPGVDGIEGSPHGHDVIPVPKALAYLKKRGYDKKWVARRFLYMNRDETKMSVNSGEITKIYDTIRPSPDPYLYIGSTREVGANRVVFGDAVSDVLDENPDRKKDVMVIDSDLEGSTGLKVIHQRHPDVFVPSGIMERGNLSAAAGFGFGGEKQGVFSTFSAFAEMCISELTMARLNDCNLLCHFSHSGVDEMADNTVSNT